MLEASNEKPGDINRFVYIISVTIVNYAIYPTVQGGPTPVFFEKILGD